MKENTTATNTSSIDITEDNNIDAENTPAEKPKMKRKFSLVPKKKWQKILLIVIAILLVITAPIGAVGFYTLGQIKIIEGQAKEAEIIAREATDAFKSQNLPGAEARFQDLGHKVDEIDQTYQRLSFYNNVPIANRYFQDGQHGINAAKHGVNGMSKVVITLAPYADVLGFQGEGSFTGGSAENRVKLLLDTLDKIMPEFNAITDDLGMAKEELAQIDPERYPEEIKGVAVREKLVKAQEVSDTTLSGLIDFKPVLEQLPKMAGGGEERKKYLILFQNDNELRPTGGFLTAYSVIYVQDGVVTPEKSDDIYELDKKFNKKIAIPESLGKYLTTEKYWNMRDMNISPDFQTSMDQFFEHYQEVRGEPDNIDGIVAIDTHVLTGILEILGPVEVPGYGTFSAEIDPTCDCPQVVHALSEIITRPTPYHRTDRKGILGPMMQSVLVKTYAANKTQWPSLFNLAWTSLEGKHIQLYFVDEEPQMAAEAIDGAGRMMPPAENTDFIAIINANLGGAKSNLYVDYDVMQTVSAPQNGEITKTVEISYKNRRKGDNCNLEAGLLCLNSTLNDWTRLYLPEGSKIVETQGFNTEPTQYDEDGFTVIDGFFNLEPLGTAKVKVTYTVPYTDTDIYRVELWKQGGVSPITTIMDVTGGQEEVVVDKNILYETEF